jgi:hypothetical protein
MDAGERRWEAEIVDVGVYSSSLSSNGARKSLDVSQDQLGNPKRKV